MLEVYLPYPKKFIAQRFGENATSLYAADGILGHSSYDWSVPYHTPIPNCTADAYCYSLMHKANPVLMDYRAVFFLVPGWNGFTDYSEVSYGHLSDFVAEVGKTYQVGDTIGFTGNTGPVYQGNHEVTEAEKDAGSTAGTHLHGPQIRPVLKVRTTNSANQYLSDDKGLYRDTEGNAYQVYDWNNGYHGCISLKEFSTETLATAYKPQEAPVDPSILEGIKTAQEGISRATGLPVGPQRNALIQGISALLSSLNKLIHK